MERTTHACEIASIAAARHHTVQQFDDWGLRAHSEAAALLVSELATNAVIHAESAFELALIRRDDSVGIVVSDRSTEPPVRQGHDAEPSGFGLNIVSQLASDWGWEREKRGKKVWAVLATRSSSDLSPST
jgi:anti-sigma regulatory factor (Ser/Thr protein kinase)